MILDLHAFLERRSPGWDRLEAMLDDLERNPHRTLPLAEAQEFHLLFRRIGADLAQVRTFASEPALVQHLERLAARAYTEIHGRSGRMRLKFRPLRAFFQEFPAAVRRNAWALRVSIALTIAGALAGAGLLALDPGSKAALLPFVHLQGDPADRVAEEEAGGAGRLEGHHASFAGQLMVNNIRVTILAIAGGMLWATLTCILLFYNGVILGAVCLDYIVAGQGVFLAGWLLPHGSVEIPAILLGGQGGLMLGKAILGRGDERPLGERLAPVWPDLLRILFGATVFLVWAGVVESFFSQFHAPVIPYSVKIAFGAVQFAAVVFLIARGGRERT